VTTPCAARVRLRSVTSGDLPFLFELYASTREEELAAWGWDAAQTRDFLRMQFEAQRRGYDAAYPRADDAVILLDEGAVGRLLVARASDHIRLVDIAVLPPHRGTGIGSRLIGQLIGESVSSGRPLRLQVARGNRAANLYGRLGFSVTAEDAMYREMQFDPARAIDAAR